MGWRNYGEKEPEESMIGDFFLGLFIGGIGVPSQFGWILVSLGWLSFTTLLLASGGIGFLLGTRMAYGTFQRKKEGERLCRQMK